jgi:iron-sulfur cluster assembly protein
MSTAVEVEIKVTPKAVQKIRHAFTKMGVTDTANAGLRLGVLGGGCSGLSYQFKFDTKPRATDKIYDFDGVHIFIDPKSARYLAGMTLDYKETLMESGFVFENPNAKKSCGCGTSFSA